MADRFHEQMQALYEALLEEEVDCFLKLGQGPIGDQLFVAMDEDSSGRILHVQTMFLPGSLEIPVLQVYAGLPYELAPDAIDNLARFLLAVNANTPFGEFGYLESAALLYFRCNLPSRIDPFDIEIAMYTIAMSSYVVGRLGGVVERVAGGHDLNDAFEELTQVLASELNLLDAERDPGTRI